MAAGDAFARVLAAAAVLPGQRAALHFLTLEAYAIWKQQHGDADPDLSMDKIVGAIFEVMKGKGMAARVDACVARDLFRPLHIFCDVATCVKKDFPKHLYCMREQVAAFAVTPTPCARA